MYAKLIFRKLGPLIFYRNVKNRYNLISLNCPYARNVSVTAIFLCKKKEKDINKSVMMYDSFENITDKNKETYLDMVKIFETRDVHRRGHVEFIYSALRHMESFNVHKDLEVYKSLVDVLPKGKFIPTNIFQAEFMHYPKQQQCCIDLLQQMEDNGVVPDFELEDILINIFGRRGYPLRKYWRMMYWMPKFKNLSPFPLPAVLPQDSLEIAKLAIARITGVDLQSVVTVYQSSDIKDSVDDTWIVSGQSPVQQELLQKHNPEKPIYVEGFFRIWLRSTSVNYFTLRADAKPSNTIEEKDPDDVTSLKVPFFSMTTPDSEVITVPSVHEQEEGTILAVCATGTSSRDSLLSWVRHLERNGNPALEKIPVVFTLRAPQSELVSVDVTKENETSGDPQKLEDKK